MRDGSRSLILHPGYLGDTVFLGPTVRAVRARWPEGRVALCVTPRGEAVARLLPGCDEVFVYDKRGDDRGLSGFWRVARDLRAFGPDRALVPHYSARSGLLAWASGAPTRIGYAPFCTDRLALNRALPFVDRTLVLAQRAGATAEPALELRAPEGLQPYVERALAGASRPVIGLVPGAEWRTKRWGAEHYAGLATELSRRGATVVLLGGPGDVPRAQRIRQASAADLRDTTGNSITEAIAVLARCDVVIGGDTGLVHCARALHRPTVVLFGPTDPARHRFTARERFIAIDLACRPCHDHGPARCPLEHHDCMRRIAVAQVAAEALALLDAAAA